MVRRSRAEDSAARQSTVKQRRKRSFRDRVTIHHLILSRLYSKKVKVNNERRQQNGEHGDYGGRMAGSNERSDSTNKGGEKWKV